VDALIGKKVTVLEALTPSDGRVKLNGEIWSAQLEEGWDELPADSTGTVVEIRGATAIIRPY
jgi:membrane protein implicated in regulation of membrane protease activity